MIKRRLKKLYEPLKEFVVAQVREQVQLEVRAAAQAAAPAAAPAEAPAEAPAAARARPASDEALGSTLFRLLDHASNYDLSQPSERLRSHHDLQALFYEMMIVIKPDTFVEAGAFFAEASREVKTRLPKSRVVAFEANPHNYEMCRGRFDYEAAGIEYIHTALSSEPGEITFKVQATKDGEQLKKTTGRSSILERRDADYTFDSVTVPATTLDRFFADVPPKRSVLWVDVEGALEQVLSGADQVLESAEALFIEVEDKPLWDGQCVTIDVARHLSKFGLEPVARDFESPSRVQYNMIFMKRRLLGNRHLWRYFSEFHSRAGHPSP